MTQAKVDVNFFSHVAILSAHVDSKYIPSLLPQKALKFKPHKPMSDLILLFPVKEVWINLCWDLQWVKVASFLPSKCCNLCDTERGIHFLTSCDFMTTNGSIKLNYATDNT